MGDIPYSSEGIPLKFTVKDDYVNGSLPFGNLTISSYEDLGFLPTELLVASIASCSGLVFQSILKKQRVKLDLLTIDADVVQNPNEANRIEKVILTFTVKGKNLNKELLLRNLSLTSKYCTIIRSVDKNIDVDKKLVIL